MHVCTLSAKLREEAEARFVPGACGAHWAVGCAAGVVDSDGHCPSVASEPEKICKSTSALCNTWVFPLEGAGVGVWRGCALQGVWVLMVLLPVLLLNVSEDNAEWLQLTDFLGKIAQYCMVPIHAANL